MIKGTLINDNKTRRKSSMLQGLSKIKYYLVLAVLLVLPMLVLPIQANAGHGSPATTELDKIIDQTDKGALRLVYFIDRRDRETFLQVTNTSAFGINIHVQVFDVNNEFINPCEECDFNDMLTPMDTHVYNAEEFTTNMGGVPQCVIPDGHYGFVVISFDSFKGVNAGPCGDNTADCIVQGGPLIGMFRIIDEAGYEYRTNAAGKRIDEFRDHLASEDVFSLVNFNLANGNNLSDLVGITFFEIDHRRVGAAPQVNASFGLVDPILIYDQVEVASSCSPTFFSCMPGNLDKAIDNSLPNSKGQGNRICSTNRLSTNTSGWLHMPFSGFVCQNPFGGGDGVCDFPFENHIFFVGFRGLNNGDGTGGMDSWWVQRGEDLKFGK